MNKKRNTLFGIILFAAFLAIAYFAYDTLSEKHKPNNTLLLEENTAKQTDANDPTPTPTVFDTKENADNNISLDENTSEQIEVDFESPDFTVFDAKGNAVKLSDFSGKPIVLNFWASWCPPCKAEMPHFDKVYADVKDDVVFIMVDLIDGQRETETKGQKYVEKQGYDFPIYFDSKQEASNAYEISSIPSTLFINSSGEIVDGYQGAINEETLISAINLIKK